MAKTTTTPPIAADVRDFEQWVGAKPVKWRPELKLSPSEMKTLTAWKKENAITLQCESAFRPAGLKARAAACHAAMRSGSAAARIEAAATTLSPSLSLEETRAVRTSFSNQRKEAAAAAAPCVQAIARRAEEAAMKEAARREEIARAEAAAEGLPYERGPLVLGVLRLASQFSQLQQEAAANFDGRASFLDVAQALRDLGVEIV